MPRFPDLSGEGDDNAHFIGDRKDQMTFYVARALRAASGMQDASGLAD